MFKPGLIWIDEDSARDEIARMSVRGDISADEAASLTKFNEDGYFITHIDVTPADAEEIERDVDRLWRERGREIAFAYDSPPRRFSEADPVRDRRPRYRIHDLHAASSAARRLYLHPTLHRYASLILGTTAVATQSLYFEFGSQQALHRDSIVVPTPEFGRLVAAWIALEDIAPESGPLVYVPGSQRFPFYRFGSDGYVYDPTRHTAHDVEKAMAFYDAELRKSGRPVKAFTARRGEVLIWHSALMHGGALPADERRTRRSFVVHYSARQSHPTREFAVEEMLGGGEGQSVFSTDVLLQAGEAYGFANPLEGRLIYRR